jgi:hypothetical protein
VRAVGDRVAAGRDGGAQDVIDFEELHVGEPAPFPFGCDLSVVGSRHRLDPGSSGSLGQSLGSVG